MSFKPKLIIYRAQRHHLVREYNRIHGLLSSKLEYTNFKGLQDHQKRICQTGGSKILRNVNFDLSIKQLEKYRFMKFITNFPMLDNLSINFPLNRYQNPNCKEMKRFLFKLTKQAKKISKLSLFIWVDPQTHFLFLLKHLSSLKSLQYLDIVLISPIKPLQALNDFLKLNYKHNSWPYLKELTIEHVIRGKI